MCQHRSELNIYFNYPTLVLEYKTCDLPSLTSDGVVLVTTNPVADDGTFRTLCVTKHIEKEKY